MKSVGDGEKRGGVLGVGEREAVGEFESEFAGDRDARELHAFEDTYAGVA
jgi:hypothetical protein